MLPALCLFGGSGAGIGGFTTGADGLGFTGSSACGSGLSTSSGCLEKVTAVLLSLTLSAAFTYRLPPVPCVAFGIAAVSSPILTSASSTGGGGDTPCSSVSHRKPIGSPVGAFPVAGVSSIPRQAEKPSETRETGFCPFCTATVWISNPFTRRRDDIPFQTVRVKGCACCTP